MIDQQQRAERRKYIGSSDIAAICGRDPWRSAMDVYLAKTHELEDSTNQAMEVGTRLEGAVLDWAQEKLGTPLLRDQFRTLKDGPFCSNHDALVVGKAEGVEAKTTGILNTFNPGDEWGEENTDQVPDHVLLQCQEQAMVSDLERVWVPALIGGRGWCMFVVERNEKLIGSLRRRGEEFWDKHVLAKLPPPDSMPSMEIARNIRRQAGKTIELGIDVTQRWLEAKDALKAAEDAKEAAEALLLTYMGDAEAADTPLGRITYFPQEAVRLDQQRLKADHPDLCADYKAVSCYRVLRFKKAKTK
jgi:putative phage-type endonuclease